MGWLIALFTFLFVTAPSFLYSVSVWIFLPIGLFLRLFIGRSFIIRTWPSVLYKLILPIFLILGVPLIFYLYVWEPLGWIFFAWMIIYFIGRRWSGIHEWESAYIKSTRWADLDEKEKGKEADALVQKYKRKNKGEQINEAMFAPVYPPTSEVTISEKQEYINEIRFKNEHYWSADAVAQRKAERDESYAYSREKDNEGWSEYYATLDSMKINADANEYWSQPGKFAELRRKWETSDSGLSWDAWLKQFDFEGEWYKLPPP